MNCGHLFNGIGGFALAAQWMNWNNVMHCEIDPFCNKVMNHHFPNSIQHEDIKTTDFTIWRGKIDLITGGFPCQPYSTAGKRKGKDDDRHLWPEMLRAIREIQPGWVVGENVRGLSNWNGGLVFDEVQSDLEVEGYEVLPFLLPAYAVQGQHRRDRIWIIGHFSNTSDIRFNRSYEASIRYEYERRGQAQRFIDPLYRRGNRFFRHDQSEISRVTHGISDGLAGITLSDWEEKSMKALGNAVVPQVVYQIFKAIEQSQLSQLKRLPTAII
jgi:DNA (cytosine-5)-methyltransferase 1